MNSSATRTKRILAVEALMTTLLWKAWAFGVSPVGMEPVALQHAVKVAKLLSFLRQLCALRHIGVSKVPASPPESVMRHIAAKCFMEKAEIRE
jgi:hypothetical protein